MIDRHTERYGTFDGPSRQQIEQFGWRVFCGLGLLVGGAAIWWWAA